MCFTITGMKKSVRYSVSMRTSLDRGSVISRFHCKNAVNLWRIGTDCILCHSQIRWKKPHSLCNVSSMRRSVPLPAEILRRELKIRRAAEYFNCNLRCTFSVSYTTLFTELIYPQKRHFFPKTHQTCSNSVCHSSLFTWWNTSVICRISIQTKSIL